jgi:hypothetical protein
MIDLLRTLVPRRTVRYMQGRVVLITLQMIGNSKSFKDRQWQEPPMYNTHALHSMSSTIHTHSNELYRAPRHFRGWKTGSITSQPQQPTQINTLIGSPDPRAPAITQYKKKVWLSGKQKH